MARIRVAGAIGLTTALLAFGAAPAHAFNLNPVAGGHSFDQPTYVTQPPTGGPLLIVEKSGVIQALQGGKLRSKPFLDISSRVSTDSEQGLTSVAFPPDYRHSHRFYVYYVNRHCGPNGGCYIEVDEFRRSRGTPYQAVASTRRRVLTFAHLEAAEHNGGQLQFDRRGRLWISVGDGGIQGDPKDHAQSKNSLLGKLLRINPRQHRHRRYTIPSSNPYVGHSGRDEIYARGLRNPWRFSIDRAGTAERLLIGDVGWDAREELDYESIGGARGANFGWNRFEGFYRVSDGTLQPPSAQPDPPVFDYGHNGSTCAITGGYVVHDPSLPTLAGRYLYADFCVGDIHSLVPSHAASTNLPTGLSISNPSSFGRDKAGHIYVASIAGPVYRIAP